MVSMKSEYLFCVWLLASGIVLGKPYEKSFTLVVDNSMSMLNTLNHVKNSLNRLNKLVPEFETQIADYILVTFNDPDVSLNAVTGDRTEFLLSLNDVAMQIGGGGDCPEYSMAGVLLGLEASRPGSSIYVVTDASAKDYERYEEVKALALKKHAKLVFVLTGSCGSTTGADFTVYQSLANATSGLYLFSDGTSKVNDQLKAYVINNMKKEA